MGLVRSPGADTRRRSIASGWHISYKDKRVGEADEVAETYLYLMRQTFSTG
ncbi:hypothetical protein [Acidocella sp.]|uniref:hypothetical protein n=1 Tax=Acidocella sp. TaxID=50710 RepID=UPI002F3F8673